jgi:hypothetical protein
VFKVKYEVAQLRLAESERASELESRLAIRELEASRSATTTDFDDLVKRLEEVTASCENVFAKQRERFKLKLAAAKASSDQLYSDH